MKNFVHTVLQVSDQKESDLWVAMLSQLGYDGFEEKELELHAFIEESHYEDGKVKSLMEQHHKLFTNAVEPLQNWNALWESNFEPVTIVEFCHIRADFHPANKTTLYDIVITPKMSFGTGHHATTFMMVEQMEHLDLKDKVVADFGTGTGVLAILAEKMGSKKIWAIDEDDYSILNAKENFERNKCERIKLTKASVFSLPELSDFILANINKNIIIENLERFVKHMKPGSKLLISGLLKQDEYDVLMAFQLYNLTRIKTVERNNWIAILMEHAV